MAGRSTVTQKYPGSTATAAAAKKARIMSAITGHRRVRRLAAGPFRARGQAMIPKKTHGMSTLYRIARYVTSRRPGKVVFLRRPDFNLAFAAVMTTGAFVAYCAGGDAGALAALAVGQELVAERPPGRLLGAWPARPALIWRA